MARMLSTDDASNRWREVRDRAKGGEDVVIEHHGQPAVREALEDIRAARQAERALAAYRKDRRLGRPYSEIRKELVDEGLLDE